MTTTTAATTAGADKHAPTTAHPSPSIAQVLPTDGLQGTLVGRVWVPGPIPGPAVVALRPEGVFDLT